MRNGRCGQGSPGRTAFSSRYPAGAQVTVSTNSVEPVLPAVSVAVMTTL
ncbi:hypothetical protein LV79_005642 [Actinokineospora globicatena]|nr:hypothetical protein [Actinokineospora globicatena]